jgi:flagellar basal body-associated protein FliL
MILAYLLLLTGLTISSVAIYYSVVGLTAIFSAAAVPIMIMGVSLEVAKLVCATWIKQHWAQVPRLMKTYMCIAITVLMMITSLGIFGFLSKAHNDQNLVSGDVGAKLAIYDEKIATARSNIEADRKQLAQMDAAVDQVMSRSTSENGADKANAIRNSQKRDRAALAKDIESNQTVISRLNDEAAPVRAENRKVEAEVGPIKYVAAFIYGVAPDAGMLEKAVTWIIIMIVVVFDPLAVIMLLAAQMTFAWNKKKPEAIEEPNTQDENQVKEWFARAKERARFWDKKQDILSATDSTFVTTYEELEPVFEREEIPDLTDYSEGALIATLDPEPDHIPDPEPEEELPVVKKSLWAGFSFPMFSHTQQPKVEEPVKEEPILITRIAYPESNYNTSMDERPGDYVEPTPVEIPRPANPEAAPGRNRGVMQTHLVAEADNQPNLGKAAHSDFGSIFPANPDRGDVYLRTDYLPNRLFKFNGDRWIEVDKDSTDVYAYEEAYIQHLIEEIESGRYDADSLTAVEREQIQQYLSKN